MQQPTPTTNTATPISSSRTLEAAESMMVVVMMMVVLLLLSWASGDREGCVGKDVGFKDGSTVGISEGLEVGSGVGTNDGKKVGTREGLEVGGDGGTGKVGVAVGT